MKFSHVLRVGGSSQAGVALPFALLCMLLLSVLAVALVALGMSETTIATNWRAYNTALYGADAGIEATRRPPGTPSGILTTKGQWSQS